MKRFLQMTLITAVTLFGVGLAANVSKVAAIDVFTNGACSGATGAGSSAICGAAKQDDAQNIIKNVINTMLFVLGMIAVIMIVIGGIRYVTSGGDSTQVAAAKNTVLYSVVGLVIAIMAFAIVNFVVKAFGGGA